MEILKDITFLVLLQPSWSDLWELVLTFSIYLANTTHPVLEFPCRSTCPGNCPSKATLPHPTGRLGQDQHSPEATTAHHT